MEKSKITVPKNTYVLIIIKIYNSDFDIQLNVDNKVISVQNLPGERENKEYIVILPEDIEKTYILKVRKTQDSNFIGQVSIKTRELFLNDDIEYYLNIQKVAKLWYQFNTKSTKEVNRILLKVIDKNIKKKNNQYIEVIRILLAIMDSNKDYNLVISTVNKLNFEKILDYNIRNNIRLIYANSLLNLYQFNNAIEVYLSILTDIENKKEISSGWSINKALVISNLGILKAINSIKNKSSDDNGKEELDLGLVLSMKSGDYQIISHALNNLAMYYDAKNQWYNAIATLELAEKYLKKTNAFQNLSEIYNSRGLAFRGLNQLGKAQREFRKAIEYSHGENRDTSRIGYNLALIYNSLGDYKRAKRYITIQEESSNDFYEVMKSKLLGTIERKLNNTVRAIQLHQETIVYLITGSLKLSIDAMVELAFDYQQQNQREKSQKYALLSLIFSYLEKLSITDNKTYKSIINKVLKIKKNFSFRYIYGFLSKLDASELGVIFNKIDSKIIINQTYEVKAAIILLENSLQENSIQNAKELMRILSDKGLIKYLAIEFQFRLLYLQIEFHRKNYDLENLITVSDSAMSLIDSTRQSIDVSDLALHWTHQAKSILDKYIGALIEQNRYVDIFKVLEKYYAINLREKRHDVISEKIEKKSFEIQRALNNYVKLERETLLTKDNEIQNRADEAKEHFLALKDNGLQGDNRVVLDYLSIEQVQKKLKENELFLRYYLNDFHAIVFIIDNKSFEVKKLPVKSKLRQTVKSIIDNVKNKRFKSLVNQKELFDQILPKNKINSGLYNKIIIIPDGILNLLPFSSINISSDSSQYNPLATKISIERTYSASDYFADIELPKNENTISIFSNPIFLQASRKQELLNSIPKTNKLWEFLPLPYTDQEAETIQISFPNYEINKMSGMFATNKNLLSERTRNSNIIHIATHGFFNDENLENVGIATTILDENNERAPGVLAMREVLYQPFKANLAVVSGCETTLGKEINGEGFNSLSRGLLSQGVSSVIGTIWSISDRATPVFMKEFYANLRDMNGNVSKALNATKSNFATQARFRRYRHPYYWAGFVLTSSNRGISENIFNN